MKPIKYFLILTLLPILSCNENIIQPDEQFVNILFKYDFKNELDTFNNTYQKDLVLDGLIKIDFWLTTDEQNQIIEKANQLNFFLLPDTILADAPVQITPNPGQFLRIKTETEDHSILWNIILEEFQTEQYEDFLKVEQLAEFIRLIIESKPEYKKLPPANGGYE